MGRSPGFGSTSTNYSPYSDSLSLRLRISCLTSLVNITRRSVLQKVRHHTLNGAFSLGGWSLQLPTGFHVSRSTQDTSFYRRLSYTGLLPSMVQLSNCILLTYCQIMKSYNPRSENLVWALPASLAATRGIEFSFSSSGY